MKREDKSQLIESLTQELTAAKYLYITDISDMNVEHTSKLRRLCFKKEVKLIVQRPKVLTGLFHCFVKQRVFNYDQLYFLFETQPAKLACMFYIHI